MSRESGHERNKWGGRAKRDLSLYFIYHMPDLVTPSPFFACPLTQKINSKAMTHIDKPFLRTLAPKSKSRSKLQFKSSAASGPRGGIWL